MTKTVTPDDQPEELAPPPSAEAPREESKSYWALVGRDYVSNKLAMFATWVILFVITVAVFCPLIANNRPLYIEAVFQSEYDEIGSIIFEQGMILVTSYEDKVTEDVRSAHRLFVENMNRALEMSLLETREKLRDLKEEFLENSPVSGEFDSGALEETVFATEELLFNSKPAPITKYPAFRSLSPQEIWFMAAFLISVAVFLGRRRFKHLFPALGVIALGATIAAVLWRVFVPAFHDTTMWRNLIESEAFEGEYIRTIVPYGENENIVEESRQPPTFWLPEEERAENQHFHVLGTDTNGRDVLARMVYGARISMLIGIVAVSIYVSIGIILGALAGYYTGIVDIILSRVIEVVICFPALFLILSVQAFTRPSILNIMVALGLLWWTGVARLQRAEFLRLVNLDFVAAVKAVGGSDVRVIFRHILPNGLGPILVVISFGIAGSILVESALSFLGFGVPQPKASWGDLLNNGRSNIQGNWWLTVFPGIAIFVTVTCFNLIGEGIRDALDPRRDH